MISQSFKVSCDECLVAVVNGTPCHESGCNGVVRYRRGKQEYSLYQVWSLDVWGNVRDGFEVNDRSKFGTVLCKSEGSDLDLLKALKRKEILNKRCHFKSFSFGGDDRTIEVNWAKTSAPLLTLERL